jgi:hypothetical protein
MNNNDEKEKERRKKTLKGFLIGISVTKMGLREVPISGHGKPKTSLSPSQAAI